MVIFMYQLDLDIRCPDIWLNILGMSVRVFLDEINWNTLPFPVRVGLLQSVEVLSRKKGWVRNNSFSLPQYLWAGTSVFCYPLTLTPTGTCSIGSSRTQTLGLRIKLYHQLSWDSTSQLGLSASIFPWAIPL